MSRKVPKYRIDILNWKGYRVLKTESFIAKGWREAIRYARDKIEYGYQVKIELERDK